jgi:hypothetical protein
VFVDSIFRGFEPGLPGLFYAGDHPDHYCGDPDVHDVRAGFYISCEGYLDRGLMIDAQGAIYWTVKSIIRMPTINLYFLRS